MKTGRLHRLDGPAIEWDNGGKEWRQRGVHYRVDGPAIEWINGRKEWCLNGNHFASEQKWFKALDKEDKINYLFK